MIYDFDLPVDLDALIPIPLLSGTNKDMGTNLEAGLNAEKSSIFQPVEVYMEQLAQLSLRILRSERAVCASTTPLSIASPCFNDMFEAASALITLINKYADVNSAPVSSFDPKPFDFSNFDSSDNNFFFNVADASTIDSNMTGSGLSNAPMTVIPDPGIVLLILACQQRLLSVFERICLSVRQDLQDIQFGAFDHSGRRPRSPVSLKAFDCLSNGAVRHGDSARQPPSRTT